MIRIVFIDPQGVEHRVETDPGQSLMQVARAAGVPGIEASCGGNCICATCHCHLDADTFARLIAPDALERDMLDALNDPQPTSRLTCQVPVSEILNGARVRVAASQH